jgi:hypothetical protein
MKFRLIQSNNRGLITRAGDRTYAHSGPGKGEEDCDLPTLFIWSKNPGVLSLAAGPAGQERSSTVTSSMR